MAAEHFHEHSCNDMDPECFEGLETDEIEELVAGFNAWKRGETGETCGDPDDRWMPVAQIGDDMWMAYLAAVVGRADVVAATGRVETMPQPKDKAKKTTCFRCDGTGVICDICGESEKACTCANDGDDPTFSDCEDCKGSGT